MSIDLDTHRNSILKAFNEVVSEKSSTDWALFGYEGQTNTLKVIGSGEDGLEELAEDLNTGKIMYAVVRVTDPSTTRNKHILINWQGEGAPNLRKGVCQRHLNDVRKLLHGVHVTLNARTEEEVEPEFVMAALLKASASTYNFSDRSEIRDKTAPVGTNYKRTNPLAEINSRSRNKFWEEQEAEERIRKTEEQQKKDEELKRLENERRQREILESQQRDIVTKERNTRITTERKAEEVAAQRCTPKADAAWQNELENQQKEECERAKRAEMMRLERKKEAESLIGKRTHSTRAMFESGGSSSSSSSSPSQTSAQDRNRPPPRKLKEFKPVNTTESREENEGARSNPSRGVAARWPPAADEPQQPSTPTQRIGDMSPVVPAPSNFGTPVNSNVSTPPNFGTPVNSMVSTPTNFGTPVNSVVPASSTPPAPPSKQPPEPSPPQEELGARTTFVRNLLREGLPVRSDSDEEDRNNDEWDEPEQKYNVPLQLQQQQEINKLMNEMNINSEPSYSGPIEAPSLYSNHPTPASPLQPSTVTVQTSQPPIVMVPPSQPAVAAVPPSQPPTMAVPPSQPSVVAEPPSQPLPSVPADPQPHHEPPTRHINGNAADAYRYENIDTIAGHQKQPYEAEAYGSKAHTGATNGLASNNEAAQNAEVPGIGMIYEVDGIEYQILPEHGLCARALYDYQAADDSEITFDPSEIITNIDQIDEGWWQGIGPDGMFGLFPANYVELINQPPI